MLLLTFPNMLPKWTRPDQQVKEAKYCYQSWQCFQQTIFEAQPYSALHKHLIKTKCRLLENGQIKCTNTVLSGVYISNPFLNKVGRAYIAFTGSSLYNPQISKEHEGIHWILGKLKETYGHAIYYVTMQCLLSCIPNFQYNVLKKLVLNLGVLEDSPMFNEEIIAVLHDLACDPFTTRRQYKNIRWNYQKQWNQIVMKARFLDVSKFQMHLLSDSN